MSVVSVCLLVKITPPEIQISKNKNKTSKVESRMSYYEYYD